MFVFPNNLQAVIVFSVFCLISSSAYIINDMIDKENDQRHPTKRHRPIAAGMLSIQSAMLLTLLTAIIAFVAAFKLQGFQLLGITVLYFSINIFYSTLLKHIILLDVFAVAAGFILRILAGGITIGIPISSWLLLCTLLIALFLALCKRRHELILLHNESSNHREVLGKYPPYFLDQLISVLTPATLITYALYTFSEEAAVRFGNKLQYTIPFVIYGIFRYLYLVHQKGKGSPMEIMTSDLPLLVNIGV